MTELDLDALEALASAATEGPWDADIGTSIEVNAGTARTQWNETGDVGIPARSWRTTDRILEVGNAEFELDEADYDQVAADAEFIAASREAVPALIARVRELEAQRDAVLVKGEEPMVETKADTALDEADGRS
ncbi:MAG TPA: hypothetical protein VL043_11780 [Protaetiibacter sp.]|nr:hypothetical protein [Protaetiibacter sp.]